MIGIKTRGLGHFKRNVPFNTPLYFFLGHHNSMIDGEVLKVDVKNKEYLIFFNKRRNHDDSYLEKIKKSIKDKDLLDIIEGLENKYNHFIIIHVFDNYEEEIWGSYYTPSYLMPTNFEEEYRIFCENNKKLLSSLFSNYISSSAGFCKLFYALSNGSPNVFLWGLNNFYKSVPYELIAEILYWFDNYSQFNGKLKKGSITAYNGIGNILKLRDELFVLRQEKRISSVFNMFNTQQKKLLKSIELNTQEKQMLSHFETLSKEKQINFIRKVSTMETKEDIFHQMALLTKVHFNWDRNSFMEFITNIEGLSFDIVYDANNLVILHINDYDTIKYVTRTTNWCISKNKRYWNDYINKGEKCNNKQYVLFDFNQKEDSELSIVGFTTRNDNDIIFAHSFTNSNLMKNSFNHNRIRSLREKIGNNNIVNILSNLSIPLDKFMMCYPSPYEWKRENVMNILKKVDDDHYDIIYDNDNVLLFTMTSPNDILQIIGYAQYSKMLDMSRFNPIQKKHFFICDFNKTTDDKLLWGFVHCENEEGEMANDKIYNIHGQIYNKSLNWVLYTNHLPMDLLNSPSHEFSILTNAFNQMDVELLSLLLNDEKYRNFLMKNKYILQDVIFQSLEISLFSTYSFDILDVIYNNGYKLSDLIQQKNINDLLFIAASNMNRCIKTVPSLNDYKKLIQYQLHESKIIPYFLFFTFDKIWKNDANADIDRWVMNIKGFSKELKVYYLNAIKPFLSEINDKEIVQKIGMLIIDTQYFDVFSDIKMTNHFKDFFQNKLSDDNPWKQKLVSKELITINV